MYLDNNLEFADALALDIAGGTGLALLGDVVDLGVARDIGMGEPTFLVIQVTTAVTSGGSATVSFELTSDAQAAIAVDGTGTIHSKSEDFAKAVLIVGFQIALPIPPENPAYERFLGVVTNVGTAALTAGKVNAFITRDVSLVKSYPDANN